MPLHLKLIFTIKHNVVPISWKIVNNFSCRSVCNKYNQVLETTSRELSWIWWLNFKILTFTPWIKIKLQRLFQKSTKFLPVFGDEFNRIFDVSSTSQQRWSSSCADDCCWLVIVYRWGQLPNKTFATSLRPFSVKQFVQRGKNWGNKNVFLCSQLSKSTFQTVTGILPLFNLFCFVFHNWKWFYGIMVNSWEMSPLCQYVYSVAASGSWYILRCFGLL